MLKKSNNLKKATPKEAKKTAKRSTLPFNLPKVILGGAAIFSLVVIGITAYFVNDIFIVQKQKNKLNALTEQHAKNISDLMARHINDIEKQLHFFAVKVATEKAVIENSRPSLGKIINQIKKDIPNIESIQFFPRGTAKVDRKATPPVRFSELRLITQAENRTTPKPEISKIADQQYYNVVVPIPLNSDSPPQATMLVRFNLKGFKNIALQNAALYGKVALLQTLPSAGDRVVLEMGLGVSDAHYKQRANVPNNYFAVTLSPSQKLKDQSSINAVTIYGVLLAASCLFFALVMFSAKALANRYAALYIEKKANEKSTTGPVSLLDDIDGLKAVLEVEITEEDEALLGLEDEPLDIASASHASLSQEDDKTRAENERKIPSHIFRAYDIRGIAKKEITKEIAQQIGQAIGSEVLYTGETNIIVARDARVHSPELTEFLIRGILSTGCNVTNVGTVPTPLLYFATHTLDISNSGVMVTASHNPAQYNGFKLIIDGKVRSEEDLKAIRARILTNNLTQGLGEEKRFDIVTPYIDAIFSDVALAGEISMVVDAANGVSGIVAPKLFEELGCHVTPLFCDLDGNFPNHDPDPSIEANLQALIAKVKETRADLGVAFDGDGDRVVVVTPNGKIIWPDRLLMLFAKDIVSRNPGADVVFDVKSTKMLNKCITEYGGRPILWKTGHSHMKNKMQETGAILGGEYSGHIFIKDRWFGFDDGLYAAARLIEIISLQGEPLDQIISEFPETICTPEIRIAVPEADKFSIIEKLVKRGDFGDAKLTTIDGLRADFRTGWGLARASNTSADLTLRFEADTEQDLLVIKSLFVRELKKIDSQININWEK